ncbi:hypothetical protein [Comamonas composti]|nr:hypothetical protein [Comamonas composti]
MQTAPGAWLQVLFFFGAECSEALVQQALQAIKTGVFKRAGQA